MKEIVLAIAFAVFINGCAAVMYYGVHAMFELPWKATITGFGIFIFTVILAVGFWFGRASTQGAKHD